MYILKLNWKEYYINLNMIEAHMKATYASYLFNQSRPECLELYFEDPSQEDLDSAQAYWDSLGEELEEITSYKTKEELNEEKQQQKLSLLEKSWDEMTLEEKKIILGLE